MREALREFCHSNGRTESSVARDLKLSPGTINNIVNGRHTAGLHVQRIARHIGFPLPDASPRALELAQKLELLEAERPGRYRIVAALLEEDDDKPRRK